MALNQGTICSPRCIEVLERHLRADALRSYAPADDGDLRRAVAAHHGLSEGNVLVANGSGPLLKWCIPALIETRIRASVRRVCRHLLSRRGYPIVATWPTYSKVPATADRMGLFYELLALDADHTLDVALVRRTLQRTDGLVYLCNPNNPTGRLLLDEGAIDALAGESPESFFVIDEAYMDYLPPARQPAPGRLVRRRDNVMVLRSFSFLHGLAGAHVGYALASAQVIAELQKRFSPHQVGRLSAELAIASLSDPEHLDAVRRSIGAEREAMIAGLRGIAGLTVFDSETNFFLCRFTDGRRAQALHDAALARGFRIKLFEPVGSRRMDECFRITAGLPAENTALMDVLRELLSGR
jgi:histidinol-phosphate aminotransferase